MSDNKNAEEDAGGEQQHTPQAIKENEKDRKNPFQADEKQEDNHQLVLPEIPVHKRDRSDENIRTE